MATISEMIQNSPAFGAIVEAATENGKARRKQLKRTLTVFQNWAQEAETLRNLSSRVLYAQIGQQSAELDYASTAHLVSSVDDRMAREEAREAANSRYEAAVAAFEKRKAVAIEVFGAALVDSVA